MNTLFEEKSLCPSVSLCVSLCFSVSFCVYRFLSVAGKFGDPFTARKFLSLPFWRKPHTKPGPGELSCGSAFFLACCAVFEATYLLCLCVCVRVRVRAHAHSQQHCLVSNSFKSDPERFTSPRVVNGKG